MHEYEHTQACNKESKQRIERETYTHWLLSAQSQLPHLSDMVSDKLRERERVEILEVYASSSGISIVLASFSIYRGRMQWVLQWLHE